MPLYVGTSGFSYIGWKGKFYPKDLKSDEFLSYYSQHLNSVEINNSFYAAPSRAMVQSWSNKTGDRFKFAFKAPREITHNLKLGGPGSYEATARLETTLDVLGEKEGPVLFQLPPFLQQDPVKLEQFLSNTKDLMGRVFEFRHASWFTDQTYRLLDRYNAGFCIADTEDMKPVIQVTGRLAYFRLRRDKYDEAGLNEWFRTIEKTAKNAEETYVFLRHDETGENATYALELLRKK